MSKKARPGVGTSKGKRPGGRRSRRKRRGVSAKARPQKSRLKKEIEKNRRLRALLREAAEKNRRLRSQLKKKRQFTARELVRKILDAGTITDGQSLDAAVAYVLKNQTTRETSRELYTLFMSPDKLGI